MLPVLMLALALQEAPSRTDGPPVPLPDVEVVADPVEGTVVVRCAVRTNGRLHDCEVISETPTGQGFGEAALAGANKAHVRTAQSSSWVIFTMQFRRPPDSRPQLATSSAPDISGSEPPRP
jgi:TonB family protein